MLRRTVTIQQFMDYLALRGTYVATPVINLTQVASGEQDPRVIGYDVAGPRGHKQFFAKSPEGLIFHDQVELFCDEVDYDATQVEARRATG